MREIKIKKGLIGYFIYRQKGVGGFKYTRYRTGDNRHVERGYRTTYLTTEDAISALIRAKRCHRKQLEGEIFTTIPKNEIISGIDSRDYIRYN